MTTLTRTPATATATPPASSKRKITLEWVALHIWAVTADV